MKEEEKYNLEYWQGSKHIETTSYNLNERICKSIAVKKKQTGNYSSGKFFIYSLTTKKRRQIGSQTK